MATMQKLKPCWICKTDEHLAIYTYDNGWTHVECEKCCMLGPGEGSKIQAARSWNARINDATTRQGAA